MQYILFINSPDFHYFLWEVAVPKFFPLQTHWILLSEYQP